MPRLSFTSLKSSRSMKISAISLRASPDRSVALASSIIRACRFQRPVSLSCKASLTSCSSISTTWVMSVIDPAILIGLPCSL